MNNQSHGFKCNIVDRVPSDAKHVNPIILLDTVWFVIGAVAKVAAIAIIGTALYVVCNNFADYFM